MDSERSLSRRIMRREYTSSQKELALLDAARLGTVAAGKRHSIPPSTLSGWKKQVSVSSSPEAKRQPEQPAEPFKAKAEVIRKPLQVAKIYTPSQKAEILEHAASEGVTATHKKYNVSRYTIYDWQRKLRLATEGKGASPVSGPDPRDVEAQRDKEILDEWHRHPGLGPSQIRNQLRRKGVKVAVQTTRRVMEEAGYRPPKVKRQGHDERFEAVRPNHLWHLDYVHRFINRTPVHTLILLGDHSRFVVGHGTDDAERADLVIETFDRAVRRHGKPEMVLHDKGSTFWSWRGISRFTALLTDYVLAFLEVQINRTTER